MAGEVADGLVQRPGDLAGIHGRRAVDDPLQMLQGPFAIGFLVGERILLKGRKHGNAACLQADVVEHPPDLLVVAVLCRPLSR